MNALVSSVWCCVVLSLLCVHTFGESTNTFWSSSYNRTRTFSRRTRDTSSPAPIDCKLKSWTSWTPCDSCTDKTVRFQYVEHLSQFGGTRCVHSQWDEKLCPQEVEECNPQDQCGDMYACPESGRCIGQHLRCNGDNDCMQGSDEDDCQEIRERETKCVGMLPIPGAEKAIQGYNALSDVFVDRVLDHNYFGGICEYIYNGEWRMLTYDAFCENLYYSDDEKYFRMPYNFLSYRLVAQSTGQESSEYYSDATELLEAIKTENSFNMGVSVGVMYVEVGLSGSIEYAHLENITKYDSKDVGFLRLVSRVETTHFKMRSQDLMLHEDMLMSLMELPEVYDFGAYSRFISKFGTHYVTSGVMGGVLDYVVVVNKQVMIQEKLEWYEIGGCFGASLGLSTLITQGVTAKVQAKGEKCEKIGDRNKDQQTSSNAIVDVIGFVKGGTLGHSAAQLAIRDANTYRQWGKSLKYSPAVIDHETLPIYELVRSSTAAAQAGTRLPHLKRAWEEYMQQFNRCRCAPCRNNGVPLLSLTACSCICPNRYIGTACEKSQQTGGPTHGAWSCWSSWSACVSGTRTQSRECNNPAPNNDGLQCLGKSVQRKHC
ncbi:complement component C8 alpha chain [Trichomycterus rosablanca]|uniref:complement component C8 alpha chain n=1 Tax=Trichomycterus rosablanca TaxID=2290929 RepID=UPI002F35152C